MMAKDFILRCIHSRKRLVGMGMSRRDSANMQQMVQAVEKWMSFWNPNEAQCVNYLRKQRALIEKIMPGPGSKSHDRFKQELNSLIGE